MREAYGPVADRLADYVTGAAADAIADVADELLAIGDLLRREPRLRRAVADPARQAADRAELLRELLSGKVDAQTLTLAEALVSARWSGPSALRDAFERLGVDALLASAQRGGELRELEDELFRFAQIVDGSPELAVALGDPRAPVAQRAELVSTLLAGKARRVTVRLAQVALAGFGGRGFVASLARLVELVAAARDRQVAYVTAAVALTDEDEARLSEELSERYGRQISLKVSVDPEIIGGLSVRIGSDLYDGTILRRLTEARSALTR